MPGNDSHKALLPALLFIFLAMLAVMFLFELAKQTINPGITTWESHAITIVFTSVLALAACLFPAPFAPPRAQKNRRGLRLRQETEEKLQKHRSAVPLVRGIGRRLHLHSRQGLPLPPDQQTALGPPGAVRGRTTPGKPTGVFHTPPAETRVFEEQVRQFVGSKSPVQAEYGKNGKYFLRNLYPAPILPVPAT